MSEAYSEPITWRFLSQVTDLKGLYQYTLRTIVIYLKQNIFFGGGEQAGIFWGFFYEPNNFHDTRFNSEYITQYSTKTL